MLFKGTLNLLYNTLFNGSGTKTFTTSSSYNCIYMEATTIKYGGDPPYPTINTPTTNIEIVATYSNANSSVNTRRRIYKLTNVEVGTKISVNCSAITNMIAIYG